MSSDQNHSSDRMSALRARLDKFETVDDFVSGYSQYFFRGGILLPTRHAKPEGTLISMQIEIAGGETVLRAEGEVKQVRRNDLGRPVGMVIRFSRLDARSREIVDRVLQHKKKIAETGSMQAVVERATARRAASGDVSALGEGDLNAIAEAIDDTFDSIFSGAPEPAVTIDTPIVPDALGGMPSRAEADDLLDPPTGQLAAPDTHDGTPAVFDEDEAASLRAQLAGDDEDDDALEAIKQIAAALEGDDDDIDEPATQQVPRAPMPAPARTVFGMPAFDADDAGPPVDDDDDDLFGGDDEGDLTDQHDIVDDAPASAADFLGLDAPDVDVTSDAAADDDEDDVSAGENLTASGVYRTATDDGDDSDGADTPPPVDAEDRDDDDDPLKAAITGAYDAIDDAAHSAPILSAADQPMQTAPKGLFARFVAWIKRLFGG